MTLPSPPHPTLTLIILLRALLSSSIGYDPCGPNDTVVFTVTINQRCHLTINNRFPSLPSPIITYHTQPFSRTPMDPVENVSPAPNPRTSRRLRQQSPAPLPANVPRQLRNDSMSTHRSPDPPQELPLPVPIQHSYRSPDPPTFLPPSTITVEDASAL